jgi:hypothetical protein
MPDLTRRRHPECQNCWHVMYGDVRVGTIAVQPDMPLNAPQWRWDCGFYPVSHRGLSNSGYAPTFNLARNEFENAWPGYLVQCTDADFAEYRRHATGLPRSTPCTNAASGCRQRCQAR